MSNWRKASLGANILSRSSSKEEECSGKDVDLVEFHHANLLEKRKELLNFNDIAKERRQNALKSIELTKERINQTAEELKEAVERDRKKLLQEVDLFGMTTKQESDKLESELQNSLITNDEFLERMDKLRSCSPEKQTTHLDDFRNQQKQLDDVKHDLTMGSLKFTRSEPIKGNLLGEVRLGDIDASDPYSERPVEVGRIEGDHAVAGVTVLKERIYIIRECMPNVEVYNVKDLSRFKMLKLEGLRKPSDIAAADNLNVLYISDAVGCVYKLEPENTVLTKFPADVGGEPHGIYVVPSRANNAGNLMVTCSDTRQMREFTSDGVLVRSIRFQQDVASPWHGVPLLSSWWTGGQSNSIIKKYAVCHGWESSKLHRICWIESSGKTIKTFGASNGSGSGKVDVPIRIGVDAFGYLLVADRNNNRIILLSPNLVYIRDLINKSSGIKQPRRIHLDVSTSHLYVGLIDGSVRIFQLIDA